MTVFQEISRCQICADRFAGTATGHEPRPVLQAGEGARILIAGQAPGMRVHHSGRPFTDRSGDRLRDWMGVDETVFYDDNRVAIVPMGFCFPGYSDKGSDLPPPAICARTWRARVLDHLPNIRLTLLIGSHAQKWHFRQIGQAAPRVNDLVAGWRDHAPDLFPLPHPSWRNTAWIGKNPWFERDLLPALRARVSEVLK